MVQKIKTEVCKVDYSGYGIPIIYKVEKEKTGGIYFLQHVCHSRDGRCHLMNGTLQPRDVPDGKAPSSGVRDYIIETKQKVKQQGI